MPGQLAGLWMLSSPEEKREMENRSAVVLGVTLVLLCTADWIFKDGETLVFLGKQLLRLIEYLAFWR